MTGFQLFSIAGILAVTVAGGWLPLTRPERARMARGFPAGQAFAAGVFLALSLLFMLPSGLHLLGKAFGGFDFPLAPFLGALSFALLLLLEQWTSRGGWEDCAPDATVRGNVTIAVVMTVMIAIPSFLLGTALGVSETAQAVVIFVAIVAHKGSAGFALALKMVRAGLSRGQTLALYGAFALATPIGIVVGEDVHQLLGAEVMVAVKGIILSLAAGVFLYMSTLHELKNTPLIVDCRTRRGYALMLAGFVLTAAVRLIMGEAHRIG